MKNLIYLNILKIREKNGVFFNYKYIKIKITIYIIRKNN